MADACRCPPSGELFVLVQVLPHVEVLATSFDRERLLAEAQTMAEQLGERQHSELFRWFVRPAGVHLA